MQKIPNNLKFGMPLFVASFVVFALLLWSGSQLIDESESSSDGEAANGGGEQQLPSGPVETTLVARNNSFDKATMNANQGQTFMVTLDNRDAGVLHNVVFSRNRQGSEPLVPGSSIELFAGTGTRTVNFTPPSAGGFFYLCQAHPDTMNGRLIVR